MNINNNIDHIIDNKPSAMRTSPSQIRERMSSKFRASSLDKGQSTIGSFQQIFKIGEAG